MVFGQCGWWLRWKETSKSKTSKTVMISNLLFENQLRVLGLGGFSRNGSKGNQQVSDGTMK